MAEVTLRHEGPSPKTLDSDENLRPNLRHFVAILKFVAIFALFLRLWAWKCFLGQIQCFFGQEEYYYMVYLHIMTTILCSCTANSKAPQILIFITHGKYFQPVWVLIKHWIQIHETIIITTRESESKKSICDFWTSSPPSSLNPSCWDKLLHALAHTTSTWPGLAELPSSLQCKGG